MEFKSARTIIYEYKNFTYTENRLNYKEVIMSNTLCQRLLFSLLMSCLMAFLIGAWVTFINLGWVPGFVQYWMKAFLLAWPAGFTVVVICAPTVQNISRLLLDFITKK